MMKYFGFWGLFLGMLCMSLPCAAQVGFTANDKVTPFQAPFGYGSNMGWYAPWRDEQLADIAAGNPMYDLEGVGVNALRPALFAFFLEEWGYDIRVDAFRHYQDLGIRDNTVFIGYPAEHQRDDTHYCPESRSEMFRNLYADIWDNGENGTPVNDDNAYALYLYKLLQHYKDYISIYEIWNEPDFDYSGNGWKPASMPDSWWHQNPAPCDYALKAPVFQYVRMLRISYEVIKTFDPDAYIAIGGLGYPSFLDVVLRNTDNPDNGNISADYKLKGGAYFDMMSFHAYPHIDGSLKKWNNSKGDFDYFRHSDAAVDGVIRVKREFGEVLKKHGYDGQIFPEKEYIITECNIPRKEFGNYIGSEKAQCNFTIKTLVEMQKEGVSQFYIYQLAESSRLHEASEEFQLMGLYQKITDVPPYQQEVAPQGIAYKTVSDLLGGKYYDEQLTKALLLPNGVRGAAFSNGKDNPVYVLWAATIEDQKELSTALYNFPAHLGVKNFEIMEWNHSSTQERHVVEGNQLQLTADPVFVVLNKSADPSAPTLESAIYFNCSPNPFFDSIHITFKLKKASEVSLVIYDLQGKKLKTFYDKAILPAGVFHKLLEENLESAVYICHLEIDGIPFSKRIVKTKEN